jgi:hypothetical protein
MWFEVQEQVYVNVKEQSQHHHTGKSSLLDFFGEGEAECLHWHKTVTPNLVTDHNPLQKHITLGVVLLQMFQLW